MKYPAYPEMKDSGTEWLGYIPEHWIVSKLKYLTARKKGAIKTGPFGSHLTSSDMTGADIKVYNQQNVLQKDLDIGDNYVTKEKYQELKGFTVFENDLLVTTRGTIGRTCLVSEGAEKGILHPCLMRIQPNQNKVLIKYLEILIEESGFLQEQLKIESNATTIEVIYTETMKNITVPLPPIEDQVKIVNFINIEINDIDKLIYKKEQLIKFLQEKRQAFISHAVTKGLDPDVPMKKSGIEWLGEIPEHWNIKRIKYNIVLNPSSTELKNITDETDVTFLPMEYIEVNGDIDYTNTKKYKEVKSGYTYFIDGDVLLAKITPCFENGKSAIASNLKNNIGFGTTEVHVLRVKKDKVNRKYIYYLINSNPFMKFGEAEMTGSAGQKRVPADFINNYRQGFPPLNEQQQIVEYLDKETKKIDKLIEKITQQISNLKEYRQALISNAVTGKIDVREVYQDE